jgi:hypothetical protein
MFVGWLRSSACSSLLQLVCVSVFLLSSGCRTTGGQSAVDRHQPEAVLHAYFDAWARNDIDAQKSFMTGNYAGLVREPVTSLRVLSVTSNDGGSPNTRVYSVDFEIKLDGHGISMDDGRYRWTYTLTWDAARDSWLISNYGAG